MSKGRAAPILTATISTAIALTFSVFAHGTEAAPAQRLHDTPGVRMASAGQARMGEPGRLLVEQRCARCHSIAEEGQSRYPGAQPFRNLGARWTRAKLTQALQTGILVEHDNSGVRFEMHMTDQEIADFFDYLDSIATNENPAPAR